MFVRRWLLSLKFDSLILQIPKLLCLCTKCPVQLRDENQQAQPSIQPVKIFNSEGEQMLEQELREAVESLFLEIKPGWGRPWIFRPALSMWLNEKLLEVLSILVSSAILRLLKEIFSSPSDYELTCN